MRISLVTPLYRSAACLRELYERATNAMRSVTPDYEIVFVNDGSPDDSLAIAREIAAGDPRVIVIDLSRNFGQHPALMTGLRASTGDYIFICDSDLEEDPEWIPLFYDALIGSDCDVVYGVQTHRKGNWSYRLARRMFYRSLNLVSGVDFPPNIVTARLMSRRYVNAVLDFEEREIFAAGIWHMVGFRQKAIPVAKPDRSQTTYRFTKLAGLFVNAVTAFSVKPLQMISIAGVALSTLAVVFIGYLLFQKLIIGAVLEGWTSVMATTLLLGGITLFFNGIIAIYLSTIFREVKKRPLATVREVFSARFETSMTTPVAAQRGNLNDYRSIVRHYELCLKDHGSGPQAVDWKDERSASTRYDVMLGLLPPNREPVTLLDFGCGLGELKNHLEARGLGHIRYEGLDISPAYAEAARTKLPGTRIHCLDVLQDDTGLPTYDYIVMNGIFTRRQDLSHEEMLAYLERLGGIVFKHARKGLAFNVMSMNADWKNETLFHPSFDEIGGIVSRAMSRHMVLRDNYGLYECTCYAYRDIPPLKHNDRT